MESVPYNVTTRWIFYRTVEEMGLTKKDYGSFKKWTSRARKGFYDGWNPNTMDDDTRKIEFGGYGYDDWDSFAKHFINETCTLDKYSSQENVVQVWFEARAMASQFRYLLQDYDVSMAPFAGDATINLKWRLAKELEALWASYRKPIVVLYFGDWDKKGRQIPESALRDIKAWCTAPFRLIRGGINTEHLEKYHLLENPERHGQFQWEALSETAAEEIVKGIVEQYCDKEQVVRVREVEDENTRRWKTLITGALRNA